MLTKLKQLDYRYYIGIILIAIVLVFGIIYILRAPKSAEAEWFNDGWYYRQTISITNSSTAQTNTQVKILDGEDLSALVSAGKLQADLDDLRFTDLNGNLLDYWIEDDTNASVDIWAVIDYVPADGATVYMYYGNASAVSASSATDVKQAGGTLSTISGYRIHTFTSSETFYTNENISTQTLVVAGGGGGGSSKSSSGGGGGGGAGGLIYNASFSVSNGEYDIVIGTGGAPGTAGANESGTNGTDSTFSTITATGGGAGAKTYTYGFAGGSGGGGGYNGYIAIKYGGSGVVDQGNDGGDTSQLSWAGGAGGGGAGGVGGDNEINHGGGAAGIGLAYSISGSSVTYATGGTGGYNNAGASTANTGDGGDAAYSTGTAYTGSDGIVIVRYVAVTTVTSASPSSEEKGPGPVAYWSFDEGYGVVANDQLWHASGTTTNLERNPSVETNLTGWGGWNNSGTATRERSTEKSAFGSYSFKQTVTTDGSQEGDSYGALVTEGQTYTLSFWVNVPTMGAGESISFHYRVSYSGGNYIMNQAVTLTAPTNGWVWYSKTNTIPNNGYTNNNLHLSFYTNKVGTVVYVDGVQIEQNSVATPYCDGSLTGRGEYSWSGTEHNSTSICTHSSDGSVSGAIWQTEDQCISGKCLYFNGSRDYILVNHGGELSYKSGDFSVGVWVKANALDATYDGIISTDTTGDSAWKIYRDSGLDYFKARFNSTILSFSSVSVGDWHYYSMVKSGTTLTLYLDGNQVVSDTCPATHSVTNSELVFGSYRVGDAKAASNMFNGFIDEPKIYPYARTEAQIKTDYNAGLAGVSSSAGVSVAMGGQSNKFLSDGLVGYWKMDDNDIDSHSCSGGGSGDLCDYSGNQNHGTDVGSMTDSDYVVGKFGSALEFDGAGLNNDYISVPGVDDQILGSAGTISAWVYPTTTGTNRFVFQSVGANTNRFYVQFTSGNFVVWRGNPNGGVTLISSATLNQWHHLVLTWDETHLYGYADGEYIGSNTYTNSGTNGAGSKIGSQGTDKTFPGFIDEVRVYNRALSSHEVKQLYEYAPGPVAYYNFEENLGTTLYDKSGNNNNGTLTSMDASTDWVLGKYGSALDFDGDNDYVNLGNKDEFNFGTGAFTVGFWVKQGSDGASPFIEKREDDQEQWMFGLSGGKPYFIYNAGPPEATDYAYTVSNTVLSENIWYYLTAVVDRKSPYYPTIYVNGVDDGTLSTSVNGNPGTANMDNTGNFYIGKATYGDVDNCFDGKIDEVRIYNYARTPRQILEDYGTGQAQKYPLAYWKFDDPVPVGTGQEAKDSGNYSNHAAINGASWTNNGKFGKALDFDGTNDFVSSAKIETASVRPNSEFDTNYSGYSFEAIWTPSWQAGGILRLTYGSIGNSATFGGGDSSFIQGRKYQVCLRVRHNTDSGTHTLGVFNTTNQGDWPEVTINKSTNWQVVCIDMSGNTSYGGWIRSNQGMSAGEYYEIDWLRYNLIDTNDDFSFGDSSSDNPFSVSAWINMDDGTNFKICGKADEWVVQTQSNGLLGLWLIDDSSNGIEARYYNYDMDGKIGSWHYVTATYDGSGTGAGIKIYLDTIQVDTHDNDVAGYVAMEHTTNNMDIGKWGTYYSNGFIDEVKIFNYALTEDEICQEYNQGKAVVMGSERNSSSTWDDGGFGGNTPVYWFDMEEGTGTAINSTGSSQYSSSSFIGSPAWILGKPGWALSFDGTNDGANIGFGTYSNETMTAWVYIDPSETNGDIVGNCHTNNNLTYGFTFYIDNNTLRAKAATNGDTYFSSNVTADITNLKGQWIHLGMSWDNLGTGSGGCDAEVKLYVNGKLVDSATDNVTNTPYTCVRPYTYPFSIGGTTVNSLIRQTKVKVDDVRLYDYIRTPAQIAYDYNGGKPVGWWPLDDAEGTTAIDISGNANDGTLYGLDDADWVDGSNCKFEGCLDFDGSDDKVEVADTANDYEVGDLTFSLWTKSTGTRDSSKYIMCHYNWRFLWASDTSITFTVGRMNDGVGPTYSISKDVGAQKTEWLHLVGIYKPSASRIYFYVNGEYVNEVDIGSGIIYTAYGSQNLRFGNSSHGGVTYYQGLIDDARIYNYALAPSQIKELYNGGLMRFK